MSALKTLFADFHAAILAGDAAAALPAIRRDDRLAPQKRMAIYIDGYRLRLTEAIRSDYPALLSLLGGETFDALALEYIEKNPPMGFNLDRYPHGFAPTIPTGFSGDLAALEGAIAEVFMLPESAPLEPGALANLTPEAFGDMLLKPRTASRLLRFDFPVNDWLDAQRQGKILPPPVAEATFFYVYRHENNVQRTALPQAAYELLAQLAKGLTVAEAFDAVGSAHMEIIAANVQAWFAQWLREGFFQCE